MKTPQRKFVVEFKSGRRRSTIQADSIWGDTDLKAIVRQAETEAPHLFETKLAPDATRQAGEVAQDQKPENQLAASGGANQNQPAAALTEPVQIGPSRNDHAHVGSVLKSKKHSVKRPARKAATRIYERRSGNCVDGVSDARGKKSSAAYVEAPVDELAALDAENRRLKAMLIKQLHLENLQLLKMLERHKSTT
ncbi:hypothetical protein GA0061105_10513 [Rhizobium aethiopicum]|uniref:Uncharacterized protein n=1 Tax=Rhizobium aethiopicum TaxID=1138170 RepID=A0A1C3Y2C0_9HYPH|nr:hypothetical protein [Rhizobium aethiopicum]SCB58546.1 hypothetical protein GA0061105_10513 [Rhizobium aethiopicum]